MITIFLLYLTFFKTTKTENDIWKNLVWSATTSAYVFVFFKRYFPRGWYLFVFSKYKILLENT